MTDPRVIRSLIWPDVEFYDLQWECIMSVWRNDETYCPAANMMGKDFQAGFICPAFLLAKHDDGSERECRIITTSVKDDHLRVLWGEINRFIQMAKWPLTADKGGPLIVNHRDIRKIVIDEHGNKNVCPITYLRGMVSERGEGMAGHHAVSKFGDPATLGVIDEACHDSETEVMTDTGWKFFKDLNGTEEFLTMDPVFRIAGYARATEIHRSHRKGPMFLYDRRDGNFCVTPNHNMLWRQRCGRGNTRWTGYYLQEIQAIAGKKVELYVPRTFEWVGNSFEFVFNEHQSMRKLFPERTVPMAEWVEFLGWYVSEGSLGFKDGIRPVNVNISQSKDINTLYHIAELGKELGFDPHVYLGNAPQVRISDMALAEYCLTLGRYQPDRRAPGFVKWLKPNLIDSFLTAFKLGDGYDRKTSGRSILYTSSPKLADDLQELSFKAGRESRITKRELIGLPAPNGIARHDGWVVSQADSELDSHLKIKRQHLQQIEYDGEVFCVTVPPYHVLFTRRNGVCMWSGNSGVDDMVYTQMDTWAHRKLIFGNCNPTDRNHFFRKAVREGDLLARVTTHQETT